MSRSKKLKKRNGAIPQPVQAVPVQWPQPPQWPLAGVSSTTFRSASANAMIHSDAAIVELAYNIAVNHGDYPTTFRGRGASKREREDSADPITGEALAAARAAEELAARLYRFARSRVRAQDSERKQQAKRRTREEWEAMQEVRAQRAAANWTTAWNEPPVFEPWKDLSFIVLRLVPVN